MQKMDRNNDGVVSCRAASAQRPWHALLSALHTGLLTAVHLTSCLVPLLGCLSVRQLTEADLYATIRKSKKKKKMADELVAKLFLWLFNWGKV